MKLSKYPPSTDSYFPGTGLPTWWVCWNRTNDSPETAGRLVRLWTVFRTKSRCWRLGSRSEDDDVSRFCVSASSWRFRRTECFCKKWGNSLIFFSSFYQWKLKKKENLGSGFSKITTSGIWVSKRKWKKKFSKICFPFLKRDSWKGKFALVQKFEKL